MICSWQEMALAELPAQQIPMVEEQAQGHSRKYDKSVMHARESRPVLVLPSQHSRDKQSQSHSNEYYRHG